MNKNKYSYTDFFKTSGQSNERQKAYEDSNDQNDQNDKDDIHLRYSRRHDTVTINFGTKKVYYNFDVFMEKYVEPYIDELNRIMENPLKLTQENYNFFVKIRSRQKKDRDKIDLGKTKKTSLLEKLGITDKSTYKKWCVVNHPDKVPAERRDAATELFKKVSVLCADL